MSLEKPALANAEPGRPVTAQAWNAIVTAIGQLFDGINALGGNTLLVQVLDGGANVAGATVIAAPQGEGRLVAAVPPFGGVTAYTVVGVNSGNYKVTVSAPGYLTQALDVTVPSAAPLVVNLVKAGVPMPDLFGVEGGAALAALATLSIQIDAILDVTGHEVPKLSLPAEYQNAPVLMQLPEAGTIINVATQRVRLVIAVGLQQTPVVTMPNLIGLSQSEAVAVLHKLGLGVGKTTTKSKKVP